MTDGIRLDRFAYGPIENGQERAIGRSFGEQCELNVPHPLRQFEQDLLRLFAVDKSGLVRRNAVPGSGRGPQICEEFSN